MLRGPVAQDIQTGYRAMRRERQPMSHRPRCPGTTGCSLTAANSEEPLMSMSAEPATSRPCAGIDWSNNDHAVCIIGESGTSWTDSSSPTTPLAYGA